MTTRIGSAGVHPRRHSRLAQTYPRMPLVHSRGDEETWRVSASSQDMMTKHLFAHLPVAHLTTEPKKNPGQYNDSAAPAAARRE